MVAVADKVVEAGAAPVVGRPDRAPRLERAQIDCAVQALIRHHAKVLSERSKEKKKDLLGDTWDYIHIQLTTTQIPKQTGPKPIPLNLPHPIYSADDGFSICLIVKEDSKAAVKKALQELHIEGASEVVGLQELRTDYKQYQDRRTLRDAFDLFLVDDRVMALLGRVLGKIFFSKKKQPVPIRLGGLFKGEKGTQHVGRRIVEARNSTYMFRSPGTCVSVRAARTDFAPAKATENIMKVIEQMVENTPGKWKNVQSICIKTPDSVALPVYNAVPAYLRHRPKDQETEGEEGAKAAVEGSKVATDGKAKAGKKRERPTGEADEATGAGKKVKAVKKEAEGAKAAGKPAEEGAGQAGSKGLKRKAAAAGNKEEDQEGKEQQQGKKKQKQPAAAGKEEEKKKKSVAAEQPSTSSSPAASSKGVSSKPAAKAAADKKKGGSISKAEGGKKKEGGGVKLGKSKPVVGGKKKGGKVGKA